MSWPGFLSWQYAWLALLAVPLIVFYFLKLRRPKVRIPSLMLWAQVIHDQRVNSPFQRFKRNLLLLLQLLLLMALVLAAMQPFWPLQAERGRYLAVLIDASASMAARDSASGRTRIELAKQSIGKLIDDLMADQRVSLIAVTSTAQRLTSFTNNKRELRDALAQVRAQDVPSSLDDAFRMTQAMSRSVRIDSVLLYTDGNLPERVDFELPFEVNYQQMGKAEPNLGITAFTARRAGAKAWQVFVRIDGSAGNVSGTKVQLRQEGKVLAEDYTSVKEDGPPRVMFTIDTEAAINLEAVLIPDGTDALDSDNVAYLQLPLPRPLRIYCRPEMEAFRHALGQLSDVEIHPSDGVNDSVGQYDLWIGDTPFPQDGVVAPVRLLVGVVPPSLEKLIQMTDGSAEVIDWQRSSPLLQYVQLTDVITTDQIVQTAGTVDTDYEQLGFEILIHGRTGPLLVRETGQSYHAFHLLFHPERSTLVYRVGFPILVKNLVRSAQQAASLSEIAASHTGVLACHGLEPTTSYRVEVPGGTQASAVTGPDGRLVGVAAPTVGAYPVSRNGEQVMTASASLLDSMETQLVAREELHFRETAVAVAENTVAQDRPFWSKCAWIAFALLLLEWLYFHRRVDRSAEAPSPRTMPRRTARQRSVVVKGVVLAALLANGLEGRSEAADDAATKDKKERHGLRAEYDLTGSRQREDAPLLATWKVNWEKEYLLEGNFRIEFFKDRVKYQVYESDPYALTQGDRIVRMLLPATAGPQFWMRHWMHVVFVGKDREYDLGDFDVAFQSDRHKCGLCRIVSPANTIGASLEDEIARQMRFEAFLEQDTTQQAATWIPNTVIAPWEVQDMPLSAFYYTPFDIVFLGSAAFGAASAKQVDTLDQWVQAGGRLCLCIRDPLPDHHDSFVRELLAAAGDELEPGQRGWPLPPSNSPAWLARRGLGRVGLVVINSSADNAALTAGLQSLHNFLWMIPKPYRPQRVPGDDIFSQSDDALRNSIDRRQTTNLVVRRKNEYDFLVSHLNELLLPSNVRIMPLGLTGLLLWSYLILIGPVDYFVLRYFRLQRWTWVTFPLTTVLLAILCVQVSNAYLTSQDHGKKLVIRDLDEAGNLLLENRFQMTFSGRRATTTDEVSSAMASVMSFEDSARRIGPTAMSFGTDAVFSKLSGSIPANYRVDRTIDKWSPRLDRYLAFESESPDPTRVSEPSLVAIARLMRDLATHAQRTAQDRAAHKQQFEGMATNSSDNNGLASSLLSVNTDNVAVQELELLTRIRREVHEGAGYAAILGGADGPAAMPDTINVPYNGDSFDVAMGFTNGYSEGSLHDRAFSHSVAIRLLRSLSLFQSWDKALPKNSTTDPFDFWDVPIAPHGGANFQDLAILDVTDDTRGLVLLAVPYDEQTMVVYRYCFTRPKP